jgi:hypothetical protein
MSKSEIRTKDGQVLDTIDTPNGMRKNRGRVTYLKINGEYVEVDIVPLASDQDNGAL